MLLGLLSDLPRKNCWTIAEWAGERAPDGRQHLLGRAKWDAGRVRDDVCDCVVDHLHDDQAVLVVDETGDVKKGTGPVGVQRQYTGTAGRIENAQVAVYLVYVVRRGHAAAEDVRRHCRGVGRASPGSRRGGPCRRRRGGSWWSVRLGIGRCRDRPVRPADAAPFSAGGGGVLVSADDGGVDLDQPVDVAGRVGVGLDCRARVNTPSRA
ncbi:hypothetical protein SGLAM104S_04066 [Streptomyces glaucescens]